MGCLTISDWLQKKVGVPAADVIYTHAQAAWFLMSRVANHNLYKKTLYHFRKQFYLKTVDSILRGQCSKLTDIELYEYN